VDHAPLAGLSLRDLEYAVTVARLGHFGRAAERCGVSQPTLSMQIRKLEYLLGTPLFERHGRRVLPTAKGEPLLRRAEAIIADARALLQAARAREEPLAGPLRLGVIPTLGPYYLPALLPAVRAHFPQLDLRLAEGLTLTLVEGLRAGLLDAVLMALPATAPGIVVEPLFEEPFRLLCPAGHRLARRPRIGLDDLGGPDLLLLEDGHCLRDQALALCHQARGQSPGGEGEAPRYATSLEMLRHMIAAGEGYSLLPMLAAAGRPDLGGLVAVREIADDRAFRTIGLAWRATDPREDDLRALAAFLRQTKPADLGAHRGASRPPQLVADLAGLVPGG
jgi:LysR family hydrogen peroxide-inducible transcriptional activator